MLYLKLAWRNIWRNKRRTLITMISVIMAVLFSSLMASMQQGQYDQMINNSVGSFSGHIQIQGSKYFDDPILDNSIEVDSTLIKNLKKNPLLLEVIPRIESYGLIGGDEKTKAGMVLGIDFKAEQTLSKPNEKIISGEYFTSNSENTLLISEGLASYLEVAVGDSVVILSSGYHGVNASGIFPVKGIMKFGIPELNKAMVYLPLETAQKLYGANNLATYISLLANNPKDVNEIVSEIEPTLGKDYRIYGWQTLMPELIQAIQADRGSGYIILLVLYIIVGFGIFGTVLMMIAERRYEFGVLIAIGTSRMRLTSMIIMEMLSITIFGTLGGIIISLPAIFYFNINPLRFSGDIAASIEEYGMEPFIRFSTDPEILFIQAGIILVISLVISIYPIVHMHKLKAVEAMRH